MNRAPAFIAKSRALAVRLGQFVEPTPDIAEELQPGVLETDSARSRSRPWHKYPLIRTASGWQHADTECRGWLIRGDCRHLQERNMETTTALAPVTANVLALIDELEDTEMIEGIGKQITKAWVYEFPMDGKTVRGISSTGVEEAAREWAKHGEAIRELNVKIEYEDDKEARFLAQAGRYAVSPEGVEVLLDVAIRGKRVSKWYGRKENPNWYEHGVTKAVRNAKLALLPEQAKSYILTEAVKAGRVRQVDAPRGSTKQVAPPNVDTETGEIRDGDQQQEGADGSPPAAPPPITSTQKQAVVKGLQYIAALDKAATNVAYKHLRATWPHCFGTMSNNVNALSSSDAEGVLSYIKALQGATGQVAGAAPASAGKGGSMVPPAPASACPKGGEHEPKYDEKGTVMRCSKCGLALEGPDAQTDPDDLPFDNDPAKDEPAKLPI